MMVITSVHPSCGVGNTMFHYAAAMGIAHKYPNASVCVFGLEYVKNNAHPQSVFNYVIEVLHDRLVTCPPSMFSEKMPLMEVGTNDESMDIYRPPHSIFEEFVFDDSGKYNHFSGKRPVIITGCMQSYKYFESVPHPFFKPRQSRIAKLWMARRNLTSVIHVRRGDKVLDGSVIVPVGYYEKILVRLNVSRFAICTDDPAWVKQQPIFKNATLSHGNPAFDMAVMASATETIIIGIGTFAWWGAYLSKAHEKYFFHQQYDGSDAEGFREEDYIPYGVKDQGRWIPGK